VKLLLDENISYRLVRILDPPFPGTKHVTDIAGLKGDKAI
jgi:predicted nuclease of predicted toxin-antitoxin system